MGVRLRTLPLLLAFGAAPLSAQATGRVLGEVRDAATGEPIGGASVAVVGHPLHTITTEEGRFILTAVPPGPQDIRIEMIGYEPETAERVTVRAGRAVEVQVRLRPKAVEVEGLVVSGERVRLVEPEVVMSHEVVAGRELRELPVDRVEQAIELTPGVSDGHFRGGRVGQETYVVDGLALKNQLEGSSEGAALELAPSSLEEVDVVTGGFGAEYGSALSGVVSLVTRRGNSERWTGETTLRTDAWTPESMLLGFTGLTATAGGPIRALGQGATLFVDLLAQGMGDADPRARGLTCVRPGDGVGDLDARIQALKQSAPSLYCPYTDAALPDQRGDKLIGFTRLDTPLGGDFSLTTSLLYNRTQQELYTPELKYAADYRLGQRSRGGLAQVALEWARHTRGDARHLTARLAVMRLDRHLGVIDPGWLNDHTTVLGVSPASFRFLGEDFVHGPIREQLAAARPVPGYTRPETGLGSPFGPAAEGLFVSAGGSGIAGWSRTEFVGADLVGEVLHADGSLFRTGVNTRFYRVESYERTQAWLAGGALNYALFFPATLSAFGEYHLMIADQFQVQFGLRLEGFRSGVGASEDPADFNAPVVRTDWKLSVMPRIGFAGAIPGSDGRLGFKLNYGRVAQPPDFQYFLDTTIGDSLRTDIRRQGNPNLGFEDGRSYEAGLSYLLSPGVGFSVTGFRKELLHLVSGDIQFADTDPNEFTTGDYGVVNGVEVSVRGRWPGVWARLGYALQKAEGVGSTAFGDSVISADRRVTFPLAFDRRHSIDAAVTVGRAAGEPESAWSASAIATVSSGYPLDRAVAAGVEPGRGVTYLPWTAVLDLRASREIGALPGCAACRWRITFDGRNLLGRENVIALRRDDARLAPTAAALDSVAGAVRITQPIPRESPRYSATIDLDGDGLITPTEFDTARFAAALDRADPSLLFGEARQVRLGVEVSF